MTKSSPSIWHYVVSVKSTVKISSFFVAFLENTNFINDGNKVSKVDQMWQQFLIFPTNLARIQVLQILWWSNFITSYYILVLKYLWYIQWTVVSSQSNSPLPLKRACVNIAQRLWISTFLIFCADLLKCTNEFTKANKVWQVHSRYIAEVDAISIWWKTWLQVH